MGWFLGPTMGILASASCPAPPHPAPASKAGH